LITEEKLGTIRIMSFVVYCLLTVVSGILVLVEYQPTQVSNSFALLAATIGGTIILIGSVKSLINRAFTVDFLASIAVIVSIAIGEYLAAAIVVVMLNGGELIEDYAEKKATNAIEKLIESVPMTAQVRRHGEEVTVLVRDVQTGDIILVKPGEKIPLDGIVLKGNGFVNQASITGESMPIEKDVSNDVYGNTLLESGALEIQVTTTQDDMVFCRLIRMVEEAQTTKAPIERVADRYAKWFAPVIMFIALATWLFTKDPFITAAVLVVSCPCALTLATPIAVVTSMGNAAKNGILIREGAALETVGKSNLLIVDKTGTLTTGTPAVVDVKSVTMESETSIIQLAAIAEKFSEHSIAQAIISKAKALGLSIQDPDEFENLKGYGVAARKNVQRILVGNKRLFHEHNIELADSIRTHLETQEMNGWTPVIVAIDSKIVGIISVSDTLREGVATSLDGLRSNGIKQIVMLTGDNRSVAKRISAEASIDETRSELLPEEKVTHIRKYQSQGYTVTMVGDGINDAPGLASADVGIAMGIAGTDASIETAGIVLANDDLTKLATVMKVSQHTLRIIKQNVIFSLAVNILGIILSTTGFVTPIMASIVHESSALIVVFNSLRLATQKI
jgi:Cd2+/Zn2+-exporting ATPase